MDQALARIFGLSAPALLIGSVLIVSLWGWLFKPVQRAFMLIPYRVRHDGQVYRLVTAGWVHADLWHLACNMVTLWFFAGHALRVLGPTRFLILYVTAVIVAFVPTTLRYAKDPAYGSLGASGAVAAVMLSAVLLDPRLKITVMFLPVAVPGMVFAAVYLVYSMWHSYGAGDGINHDAHFSGAVYGALLTYVFEPARVERAVRSFF